MRRRIDPYFLVGIAAGAAVLVAYVWSSSLHARKRGQRPELWPSAISDTARASGLTHVYGPANAPYVLREISDFHCQGCATAETTVVTLAKSLADAQVLQLVVYDLPGPGNAVGALVAATCTGTIEPAKYWPYRARIFRFRDRWMKSYPPESSLLVLANSIGVDSNALKKCVEAQGSRISTDASTLAKTVGSGGIYYTPSWSFQDSVFVTEEIGHRLEKLRRNH
jgi:protein-disulfide isomerase